MSNKKKNRARNKSHNSPPPTSAPQGGNIQSQPDAQSNANDCRYIKQDPPNIYVNIPPVEKEKKWDLANKIAFGMWAVTAALTLLTYLLFKKAGVQADQAIRAANSADSVYGETKKEFNLANEPFLQVDSIRLRPVHKEGENLIVDYYLTDLKSTVIKVYSHATAVKLDSVPPFSFPEDTARFKDSLRYGLTLKLSKDFDKYITKETPLKQFATSIPVDQQTFNCLTYGKCYIYFFGVVRYVNIVNSKFRDYWFEIEVKPILHRPLPYNNFLFNENEDE